MQKVIELCKRVEGRGELNYFIQNDKIDHVEFVFSAVRGFENILIGKKLIDIPRIVSRICGLCHTSQSIASCKAIEELYGVEPSFQSMMIRKVLMTAELIKSHIIHFFFHCFPDLLELFPIKKLNMNNFNIINLDPQLTSNVYDLIKTGTEINNIFGGRIIHLITTTPGGVVYKPSKKNIMIVKRDLQKAFTNIDYILQKYVDLFSEKEPPEDFDLPNINMLGMLNNGHYNRYNGNLHIIKSDGNEIEFDISNYESYFTKDINLFGIKFLTLSNNKPILTGPIARYNLSRNNSQSMYNSLLKFFDTRWKKNILFFNFIQLLEIYNEINNSIDMLENHNLDNQEILPNLNKIVKQNGIGNVEAPRGTLVHHYHLNKSNVVDNVKLYIPTEINFPFLNESIKKYAQKLYEKEDIQSVNKKIQRMVRAFDPCIACATH
jgi:coenzyme F420-reducing hydrogenase alpha subunit